MSSLTRLGARNGLRQSEKKFVIKHPVQAKNYAFAKKGVVAAGKYRSKIAGVEFTKTKAGEEAVDLLYDLTDQKGMGYHIRMRYPAESFYYDELCGALLAAGLQAGDSLEKAIGLEETIALEYPNGSTIGSIVQRAPIGKNAIKKKVLEVEDDEGEVDEDDEFDEDLLSLDEEED